MRYGVYGFEDEECRDTRTYPDCTDCGNMIREDFYVIGDSRMGYRFFCDRCVKKASLRDFWNGEFDA